MALAISQRVAADNMILSIGENGMSIIRQGVNHRDADKAFASALAQLHSFGATFLPDDSVWDFFGLRPLNEIGKFDVVNGPNVLEILPKLMRKKVKLN